MCATHFFYSKRFFIVVLLTSLFLFNHSLVFAGESSPKLYQGKFFTKIQGTKTDLALIQGTLVNAIPEDNQNNAKAADAPKPQITSISPDPCSLYDCHQLTISGNNFNAEDKLYVIVTDPTDGHKQIISYPFFEVINDQTIVVNFDGSNINTDFSAEFVVHDPLLKLASNSVKVNFLKYDPPDPIINVVEPNPVDLNLEVSQLTITGDNFTNNMTLIGKIIHMDGGETALSLDPATYQYIDAQHVNVPLDMLTLPSEENSKISFVFNDPVAGQSNSTVVDVIGIEPAPVLLSSELMLDQNLVSPDANGFYIVSVNASGLKPTSKIIGLDFSYDINGDTVTINVPLFNENQTYTFHVENEPYNKISNEAQLSVVAFEPSPEILSSQTTLDQNLVDADANGLYSVSLETAGLKPSSKVVGMELAYEINGNTLVIKIPQMNESKTYTFHVENEPYNKFSNEAQLDVIGFEPAPTITSADEVLDQNVATKIGNDFHLVLNGTGFNSDSQVVLQATANGINVALNYTSQFVSDKELHILTPEIQVDAISTADIYSLIYHVVNLEPYAKTSNEMNTTLLPFENKPTISSSTPTSWDLNTQPNNLTVYGTGFKLDGKTQVKMTANNQTVDYPVGILSPTQLTIDLPLDITAITTLKFFIQNLPWNKLSSIWTINITPNYPAPAITSVPAVFDLNLAQAGSDGLYVMVIEGTNFLSSHSYALKGTMTSNGVTGSFNLPITYNNLTTLIAKIPELQDDINANLYVQDTTTGKSSNTKTTLFKAVIPTPSVNAPATFYQKDGLIMDVQINNCTVNPCQLSGQMNLGGDMTPLALPAPFTGNLVPVTLPLLGKNQTATVTIVAKNSYDKGGSAETLVYAPEDPDQEPLEAGDVVAIIEIDKPTVTAADGTFTLNATMPVPKGVFPAADGLIPFGFLDADGSAVPAQVDTVTKYPSFATDGAAVVELNARVHIKNPVAPNTRLQYSVVVAPHSAVGDVSNKETIAFLTNLPGLLPNIKDLLKPGKLTMQAQDAKGNPYTMDLLTGSSKIMRGGDNGDVKRTVKTFDVMTSAYPGTLSHLMGVHAYVTTQANSNVVLLDLIISNAMNGLDKTDPKDDAIDNMFFKTLKIVIPVGWVRLSDVTDPYTATGGTLAGSDVYHELVKEVPGSMNYMPPRSQFHRRIALAYLGKDAEAKAQLDLEGWGAVIDAKDQNGQQLWSWWNESTGNYFPQRDPLASLDFKGAGSDPIKARAAVESKLAGDYSYLLNLVTTGSCSKKTVTVDGVPQQVCDYPVSKGVMGWAQSYGVEYGGMTGGNEIFITDGLHTAYAGSRKGILLYNLIERMYASRQAIALFNNDGSQVDVSQLLKACPNDSAKTEQKVAFSWANGVPMDVAKSGNIWGFGTGSIDQTQYVIDNNLLPYYYDNINAVDIIDYQHRIRAVRSLYVLLWLRNDPMAKDGILLDAQNVELSFPVYPGEKWQAGKGYVCAPISGSMLDFIGEANANPGIGLDGYGRAHGHMLNIMNSAYASGDEQWRANKKYWFENLADLSNTAHIPCTGFLQSTYNTGKLLTNHRAAQKYEALIDTNSYEGAIENVFDGLDPVRVSQIKEMVNQLYQTIITVPIWNVVKEEPNNIIATGDIEQTVAYCPDTFDYPSGSFAGECGTCDLGTALANGYKVTYDIDYLNKAAQAYGTTVGNYESLMSKMQSKSENENNEQYFLRVVQEVNGLFP
jgi:hypothetical protein